MVRPCSPCNYSLLHCHSPFRTQQLRLFEHRPGCLLLLVRWVGCGALAFKYCQRASFGTQKILAARYSSGSSGSAPCAFWVSNSACLASKASEMYLKKIRPNTTCLYSAASMLLRSASAAAQSLASKPRLAPVSLVRAFFFAIRFPWLVVRLACSWWTPYLVSPATGKSHIRTADIPIDCGERLVNGLAGGFLSWGMGATFIVVGFNL